MTEAQKLKEIKKELEEILNAKKTSRNLDAGSL